jgi:hypothetical protein
MDRMKSNIKDLLRVVPGLTLGLVLMASLANAQPPTASTKAPDASKDSKKSTEDAKKKSTSPKKTETTPSSQSVGEDAGNYTVTSTIEFGYRGQRVSGDVNKFKSDLNYKAGPRLFDTTLLMKSKNGGKGDLFDTLLVTSTGWGADPSGNMRISVEKPEWYRFEGTYRRFKYYRFLNNIANPSWAFSPIPTPANPVTGLHGYDTYTQMGDFDLTILPKNETIRFNVGYSPERYSGPAYTNYHAGGNEFWLLSNLKSRADDYRVGADGKLGPIDWTFLQGFRRFKDDSTINNQVAGLNINTASSVAQLTSFIRQEPARGHVNFTRFSLHTLVAKKLDITGRIIYSKATSNYLSTDTFAGRNYNLRITGWPPAPPNATPNTTNPSFTSIAGNVERPNTVGDIGITYLATDRLRLSNTFRVEDFTIDGVGTANNFFSQTRPITGGTRTDTFTVTNATEFTTVKYRKYLNTFEGDYQFTRNYSVHFGYRYGKRHEEQSDSGFAIRSNGAPALVPSFESEENHTHAFFAGFKARPTKYWTIYFDGERGSADNVFTRIGNYDYTNVRAKTRIAPNRKVVFNFALIVRDNSNPSQVAGVSLADFGVNLKTRVFTSSVDWMPNSRFTVNAGYSFSWVNSDAVVEYTYGVPPAANTRHQGNALYYQRLNYFFFDLTARLNRRMTLFTSYRLNQDNGQGNRVGDPAAGTLVTPAVGNTLAFFRGGTLITSYPMNFTSPEARLAIRLNRHLDWNLGYQYYAYNESDFLRTFPGSPRAQNYHAHLPYVSLRLYFGRKE